MMLYCFTGSDKISQENLKKTIYNKIQLNKYTEYLTDREKDDLKSLGLLDGCHMWGAEPGPSNESRWGRVEIGDRIIGYSQKKFICYGQIVYKIHNTNLAEAVWGISKKGTTWEYINVFGYLQYVDVSIANYNEFFGYEDNYKPQGFTNVNSGLIRKTEEKYGSIDKSISILCNSPVNVIADNVRNEISKLGEVELESSILNMSKKQFIEYIKSLDSSASVEVVKKCVNVRKYNKKLIDDMKVRAKGKCQICEAGNDHEVSIAEAHHIKIFSLTQNNEPENILILCPNHHRLIHKTKAIINIDKAEIDYRDGKTEEYTKIV
ncbi:hypothetical protein DIC82_17960 [Clostridium beijerinckii]|nr:hypothetical protein DIC82_17960 [Clostridium beijerinckii]